MPLTRDDVHDAAERAGEDQLQILRKYHEDAYPKSRPTPGDIFRAEAERLNSMGLGDADGFKLAETRVERIGDDQLRFVHIFEYQPLKVRLLTEPYTNYT
jgi:hypothetical protein